MLVGVIFGVLGIVVMCILCANYSAKAEEKRIRKWEANADRIRKEEFKPQHRVRTRSEKSKSKRELGSRDNNVDSGYTPMIFDSPASHSHSDSSKADSFDVFGAIEAGCDGGCAGDGGGSGGD